MDTTPIGTQIVTQLKISFPRPEIAFVNEDGFIDPTQQGYCVAGALSIAAARIMSVPQLDEPAHFPTGLETAEILMKLNSSLSDYPGLERECEALIRVNDEGNFGAAWDTLEMLLNYMPPVEPEIVETPVPAIPKRKYHRSRSQREIHQERMNHEQRGLRIRVRYELRQNDRQNSRQL